MNVLSPAPPADALPWGTTSDGELTPAAVVLGAVLGTIAVFTCPPLGVLGIVLNCLALDRVKTDRDAARGLMSSSWAALYSAPLVTLTVVVLVVS